MLNSLSITVLLLVLFSSTVAAVYRRILHQPFFPQDSFPPSPPIIPSPPPIPFSTSTTNNDTPFFPSYPPPPPPPSPSSFTSFPANISSLTVPNPKPKSAPSKLIAVAAASVAAAVAIVCLAVFFHIRKQRSSSPPPPSSYSSRSQRSDNPTTAAVSPAPPSIPKLQRPSQTSSEFLYLGTLVSSHPTNTVIGHNNNTRNNGSASSYSRKPDSPELRPLPPLNAQQGQQQNLRSADLASSKDDDESFYSPKESSVGTGSASRRAFAFAAVHLADYIRRSTLNSSSTYSSVSRSGPASPVRSVSSSLSPANSASPINTIPKSSDLIEIQTIMPLHHRIASQPRIPVLEESLSLSPSPPISSPERYSKSSQVSSPRFSNVETPVKIISSVRLIPTAPPLPPPPPPLQLERPAYEPPPPPPPPPPPELITSSRPIVVGNPTLISHIGSLPLASKDLDSDSPKEEEKNEEIALEPKLKPLHWDKVRASSDREMVWDQLKCSSFKLNEEMI